MTELQPRAARLVLAACICACGTAPPLAISAAWEIAADVRVQWSDATPSFLEGGLGKLRASDTLSLGTTRLTIGVVQPIGETWRLLGNATLSADDPDEPGDVTEAYLEYRPYPRAAWRVRGRIGAFYAPISLENRSAGWESPYLLSSSALNAWIGEELRTVGGELQIDWLGSRAKRDLDVGLVMGVYGWNDFAGAFLAARGFRAQDRQTGLFATVAQPGLKAYSREPFLESDHRPGHYVGVRSLIAGRLELRALRYDNRGDPTVYVPRVEDFVWNTRFNAIGMRLETPAGWTLIAQHLSGDTAIAPAGSRIDWDYDASFVLLSRALGHRHRLSARYDDFSLRRRTPGYAPSNSDDGDGWTLAWLFDATDEWRFATEWQRFRSDSSKRALLLGVDPDVLESRIEISIRRKFGQR